MNIDDKIEKKNNAELARIQDKVDNMPLSTRRKNESDAKYIRRLEFDNADLRGKILIEKEVKKMMKEREAINLKIVEIHEKELARLRTLDRFLTADAQNFMDEEIREGMK